MNAELPANVGLRMSPGFNHPKNPSVDLKSPLHRLGRDGVSYDDGPDDLAMNYYVCIERQEIVPLPTEFGERVKQCKEMTLGDDYIAMEQNLETRRDGDTTYSVITEVEFNLDQSVKGF